MKKHSFGLFKDEFIDSIYELALVNAKDLSSVLKDNLSKRSIDYNKFNSEFDKTSYYAHTELEKELLLNPPQEIYEYQNFFVLEKENEELVLLDGFRRLLWYNAPDTKIMVRFYKQKELDNGKILSLLVSLNHFKFFINKAKISYQERGFALLLNTVFNIDITKFRGAFDGYLTSDKIKHDYGSDYDNVGIQKNQNIKERILNPFFIQDMKFLEKLSDEGCMTNSFFASFLYQQRLESDKEFDAETFIKLTKENSILQKLTEKYHKVGTTDSEHSRKAVNQIMEMYINIFKKLSGEKIEKSYAELKEEAKQLSNKIKKDKNWIKLTGLKNIYNIERVLSEMIEKGEEPKFKCVIYPKDYHIEHGLKTEIREDIKFFGMVRGNSPMSKEMQFGFMEGDIKFVIAHNYGSWNSYGKKYTHICGYSKSLRSIEYDIDLFVNIPKSEIK